MGIAEHLLAPPTAQHFGLLPVLIALMLAMHLPYIGIVIVSSALSVAHRRFNEDLAQRFIELVARSLGASIVFGVLPLVCLVFLIGQLFYDTGFPVASYLARILVLSVTAQYFLFIYRRTLNIAIGAIGHLLLVGSYFLFTTVIDLAHHPERWFFNFLVLPHPFSFQVWIHFGIFSLTAILLSGAAMLFLWFRWGETRLDEDDPHRKTLYRWAIGLTLAGSVALPAHVVIDLATAHDPALSHTTFALGLAVLAILFVICLLAWSMVRHANARFATLAFVLSLAVLATYQVKAQQLMATANHGSMVLLAERAQRARTAEKAEQEKHYAKAVADPELGKTIFTQRCSACHAWDKKVVGPPYQETLPKYAGNEEELASYLRDPYKINPDYPPMPNQGLTAPEIQGVISYLLGELEDQKKDGAP